MKTDERLQFIRASCDENIRIKQHLQNSEEITKLSCAADAVVEAYRKKRMVILFGNGGSAKDAEHIAQDLMGRLHAQDTLRLPALALTTSSTTITALGNDYSFDMIFAHQIEVLGNEGDVAIAISTSGESQNILNGLKAARAKGMGTIGFTGATGGALKQLVEHCICIPSHRTPHIQEGHIFLGHLLCEIVKQTLKESALSYVHGLS